LVFPRLPASWLEEELRLRAIRYRVLDLHQPIGAGLQLLQWLVQSRAEVVHFHFISARSPLVLAARMAGAKVVLTEHITLVEPTQSVPRAIAKRALLALTGPLCDRRVAVSDFVARSIVDIDHVAPERITCIENGIDIDRFENGDGARVRRELGIGVEEPVIVCVSRLAAEKGVETAVSALPLIGRGAHLLLVGDGPMHRELGRLAEELGVAERTHFLSLRDDVQDILAAADVAIVPSHWEEAFGLAVVEAMAARRPVVVSRSGAMPEIVGDGGLVVPRRDPAALAGAVTRILDDPDLGRELASRAYRRAAQRFHLRRYVARTLDLYRTLAPRMRPDLLLAALRMSS
jgi:glycosyltransferase involved in cell wall biosynthesis